MQNMNRRDFLRLAIDGAAALTAVTMIPGCIQKTETPRYQTDMVRSITGFEDAPYTGIIRVHGTLNDGRCFYREWLVPMEASPKKNGGIDFNPDRDVEFIADEEVILTSLQIWGCKICGKKLEPLFWTSQELYVSIPKTGQLSIDGQRLVSLSLS